MILLRLLAIPCFLCVFLFYTRELRGGFKVCNRFMVMHSSRITYKETGPEDIRSSGGEDEDEVREN